MHIKQFSLKKKLPVVLLFGVMTPQKRLQLRKMAGAVLQMSLLLLLATQLRV